MNTFFVCPRCGNDKEFKICTTNFQAIRQSPEIGRRVDESDVLPSLRQNDSYIECKCCFQRIEYDSAAATGRRYIQATQRLFKVKHAAIDRTS
ncbi:MAG: hypothetical protein HYV59_12015 [Planctomycetes bacterium]|nr:hypothetical protein [Planctomycetota bacterium]